jgi:hypothetical protein
MIALVMLSIGILALAGTAGTVNRMMANGKRKTQSYTIAVATMDSLRNLANSTTPKCTSLATGSRTSSYYGTVFARAWTVSTPASGFGRSIQVRTSYRVGPYAKGDTINATINC